MTDKITALVESLDELKVGDLVIPNTEPGYISVQRDAEPVPALPTAIGSVVLVRSMAGRPMPLQLRPHKRGAPGSWTHAFGNIWIDLLVRDHLVEVLFDAGEEKTS